MAAADLATARECVNQAISRIKRAREQWKSTESDATSSTQKRLEMRRNFTLAESEFAWQWENVEMLLKEYCDGTPQTH